MKKFYILIGLSMLFSTTQAQVSKNRWMNYPAVKDRGLVVSEDFFQPVKAAPPTLAGTNNVAGYSFLNSTNGFYYISAGAGNWYIYPTQTWVQTQVSGFVTKTSDETVGGNKTFSGKIGIGLGSGETPGAYSLAVKGQIRAREIRVEGTAAWPDYVFAPEYKVTPLPEVEAYVKEHHHLPDMPSAAEVEKEGIQLGDIAARLLRKIEELTLLMIEKDKEIQQLKEEMSAITESQY